MDFSEFLDRGEEVLWQGRPHLGIMLRAYDIFMIPFSLLWGGLAFTFFLAGFIGVLTSAEGDASQGFGWEALPFLLVGGMFAVIALYIVVGRFMVDMIRRWRTSYAVTNKRALIYSGLFSRELSYQFLTRGLQVRVSGRRRGSIKLGPGHNFMAMSFAFWMGPSHPFMFERIHDVREVYELIRKVQEEA